MRSYGEVVVRMAGILLIVVPALLGATACATRPVDSTSDEGKAGNDEIAREQAIDIARKEVKFEPRQVEARKDTEDGRPVWRVTFRGQPPGPSHAIGEFMEIAVDRRTGEIVALSMS